MIHSPRHRSSRPTALALLVLCSCTGSAEQTASLRTEEILQRGTQAVGVRTLTLEDKTRPTRANGTFEGSTSRLLTTEIWYPAAAIDPAEIIRDAAVADTNGAFPLLIFAHGFNGNRTEASTLAVHMASHGYIVAAPDFPLTYNKAPGDPIIYDVVEQPGDISFIIDSLLNPATQDLSSLSDAINPKRIGLLGGSLGGLTALLTAFHPQLHDTRIAALLTIAPSACFLGPEFFANTPNEIPVLVLHGDIDAVVPYEPNGLAIFERATAPKYLATIRAGTHMGFTQLAETLASGFDNPDEFACMMIKGQQASTNENSNRAMIESLGGSSAGIESASCLKPCEGPEALPPSMGLVEQRELMTAVTYSFLETYLRDRVQTRDYLEDTLTTERPEVRIRYER